MHDNAAMQQRSLASVTSMMQQLLGRATQGYVCVCARANPRGCAGQEQELLRTLGSDPQAAATWVSV